MKILEAPRVIQQSISLQNPPRSDKGLPAFETQKNPLLGNKGQKRDDHQRFLLKGAPQLKHSKSDISKGIIPDFIDVHK